MRSILLHRYTAAEIYFAAYSRGCPRRGNRGAILLCQESGMRYRPGLLSTSAMRIFVAITDSEPRLALNRAVVPRFRLYLESVGLAAGTVNQRLPAVKRLSYEAADSGLLSPELAAGIRRVKGAKQLGARTGNWLTQDQARLLLEKGDGDGLRSVRDLAMLSVNVIRCVVRRVAERIQLVHLAPHDLRRTCAKLCHVHGGELEQIQFLLGHVSVLTTERYLGCKQNLEEPVNDRFACLFSRTSVELR